MTDKQKRGWAEIEINRRLQEYEKLKRALAWLENHEPELVDAARERFELEK